MSQSHEQPNGRWNGHRDIDQNPAYSLSRGLGWFSVGLGTAQIIMPNRVSRLTGFGPGSKRRALQRLTGARELITGVGILTSPRPAPWLWVRVGGDLMDLAMLGGAFGVKGESRARIKKSVTAVLGVTAADLASAMQMTAAGGSATGTRPKDNSIPVEQSITVWKQPDEVYAFWRDFENFPEFMNHIESVEVTDDRRSRWKAKGPAGRSVEWDAEIIEDRPNEVIAWRSLDGSRIATAGGVRFAPSPDGQGTEVHVHMHYRPPAGAAGMTLARLFGEEPAQQLKGDLRRFKQMMEVGEVVRSDGSLFEARVRTQRAEQPPEREQQPAPGVPAGVLMEQGAAETYA